MMFAMLFPAFALERVEENLKQGSFPGGCSYKSGNSTVLVS
jgi:hypothetical protein